MRTVIKRDKYGNVVARYISIRDAAKDNYVNHHVMWRYCHGRVKRPSDGYFYEFGEEGNERI